MKFWGFVLLFAAICAMIGVALCGAVSEAWQRWQLKQWNKQRLREAEREVMRRM